ncbi:hypothetical protein DRP43_02415, partial [candidate division TA06 bacterium]
KWTGRIGTLNSSEIITYYLLLMAFFQSLIPAVDTGFFYKIRSGGLDGILTLPVNLNYYFISMHLEVLIFKFLLNSIIFIFVGFSLKNYIIINFHTIPFFLIAFSISIILYFELRLFFTQFAFFIEREGALASWSYFITLFFSGGILPIMIFPTLFKKMIYVSPFPYLIDYPISIYLGTQTFGLKQLLIPLSYIIILTVVNKVFSEKGLKAYMGYGG